MPVKRKDGSVFYADINASPIIINGKPCLLGVFRDVTERKRAEEKLIKQKEKYEKQIRELKKKLKKKR